MSRGYQYNYSDINSDMLNYENRIVKAKKIAAVLMKECNDLGSLSCLDIGCSGGIITHHLSSYMGNIIGIDIDQKAIETANQKFRSSNCQFIYGDSMNLPFDDFSFDIVICNHIYEHVPDSQRLINEIYRVLKKNGVCYFGAGNKYMIKENHYKLYFLSWLPQKYADLYIKKCRNINHYYEKHLSYNGLKKLVAKFEIKDYTEKIILEPYKYHESDRLMFRTLRMLPGPVRRCLIKAFTQTFIWVIKKN